MTVARPFRVHVQPEVLADLRRRIAATRWPPPAPGPPWSQGADLDYLRTLLRYWGEDFDWAAVEERLNRLHHVQAEVDGVVLHAVHERARDGRGVPLILTHGWPSSFLEYLPMLPLLTDPVAHGLDGPSFDVVVPSLPGYGFSQRPDRVGVTYAVVADLWLQLMSGLGYERFGAGGGDFGAGVSTLMALRQPERVIGLHLTTLELQPVDAGERPWSPQEQAYRAARAAWEASEYGYAAIQSTKPQTIGYGLTDSPAGLAAWIVEKWRSWTQSDGDPMATLGADTLAALLTLYWVTGTATTAARDYFDNRWHAVDLRGAHVEVPTAVAVFPYYFVPEGEPPREYVERLYDVQRWTVMSAGGHFGSREQPRLVAEDLAAFFGDLA